MSSCSLSITVIRHSWASCCLSQQTEPQSAQQWRLQCHSQHNNEGYNVTVSTTMKGTMVQSAQKWIVQWKSAKQWRVQCLSQHNNEGTMYRVTVSTTMKGVVSQSAQILRVKCNCRHNNEGYYVSQHNNEGYYVSQHNNEG